MSRTIILAVTNDLSMDQRVHRIAMTLGKDGWNVSTVGRVLPTSTPKLDRPYPTHRFRMRVQRGKWFYFWYNVRLFFFLFRKAPSVVYANDLDTLPGAWLAARIRGRKLVYDSHEWWLEIPELNDRPKIKAVWAWLEKNLFKRADLVLTVNQALADIYSSLYNVEVLPVRNVPFRRQNLPGRETPGNLIWYQGALNEGRGLELMIESLLHLPEKYSLGIAGDGPLRTELKELSIKLGLQSRIEFHGAIPLEKLAETTQIAAIGLSLEDSYSKSYQVATPNKVFDYVQNQIPVLVSNLPQMTLLVEEWKIGEVLQDEERTPQGLAKRIQAILEDDQKWSDYRMGCYRASAVLCWEEESGRLLEAMRKVS
jgi:glycosyltransferase involved in cell wall biosynthesis